MFGSATHSQAEKRTINAATTRVPGPTGAAIFVGVFAAVVSVLGSWVPSYWSDEVASLRAARLTWQELFEFTGHIDGVHVAYYCVLKVWTGVFGESELATRSLSAACIGLAAAGLVRLVFLLSTTSTAVMAGVIFAVLPRITFLGIESRSFALNIALVIWMTIALVQATELRRRRWWVLYSVLLTVAIYVFLYAALLVGAHLIYALARGGRRVLGSWFLSVLAAVVLSTPIFLAAVHQRDQISWLSEQSAVNPWAIFGAPVFETSWLVALLAWAGLLLLVLRARVILASEERWLCLLACVWFIVPTTTLLMADAVVGPLYTGRYLAVTAPAMAILLAIAIKLWAKPLLGWTFVAVIVVATLPTYVGQREPLAKNGGSDLAQISDYVAEHSELGDAIYLEKGSGPSRPRQALYAYPRSFAGLVDIGFEQSFVATGTFSDRTASLKELPLLLTGVDRIWVVTAGGSDATPNVSAHEILAASGYSVRERSATNRSLVTLYER
ncbi:mannosyltransferase [Agreia bicolorata]|uniref:Mannosyltransferase n=1 Tax=Agreia bicolorata TaxID=110935 RepID=A0A1T4YII1_9MICO|nr:mannosyltransferase [Agreia bicolorata]